MTQITQADSYPDHQRRQFLIGRLEALLKRYYPPEEDPYRLFEEEIRAHLRPHHVILDAGCGRTAPILQRLAPLANRGIGIDAVDFGALRQTGLTLVRSNLTSLPLKTESVDVVISRSVVEHLSDPAAVFSELRRVMKPGGRFIFISPNIWSYPIVAARLIPNRFHAWLVAWAEGRPRQDTFNTYHRANSFRMIRKVASEARLHVVSLRYLSMFPNYLMFHPWVFRIGIAYERTIRRFRPLNHLQHWILAVLLKPAGAADHRPQQKGGKLGSGRC